MFRSKSKQTQLAGATRDSHNSCGSYHRHNYWSGLHPIRLENTRNPGRPIDQRHSKCSRIHSDIELQNFAALSRLDLNIPYLHCQHQGPYGAAVFDTKRCQHDSIQSINVVNKEAYASLFTCDVYAHTSESMIRLLMWCILRRNKISIPNLAEIFCPVQLLFLCTLRRYYISFPNLAEMFCPVQFTTDLEHFGKNDGSRSSLTLTKKITPAERLMFWEVMRDLSHILLSWSVNLWKM